MDNYVVPIYWKYYTADVSLGFYIEITIVYNVWKIGHLRPLEHCCYIDAGWGRLSLTCNMVFVLIELPKWQES